MTGRPPYDPAGPASWRVGAVLGLITLMAVALVVIGQRSTGPGGLSDVNASEADATTVAPQAIAPTAIAPTTVVAAPTTTMPPVTTSTTAVSSTTAPTTTRVAAVPAAGRLRRDLDAAFAAWGDFAVSGDLELLVGVFDKDGPQYALLESEAPAIVEGNAETGGDDPEPFVFVVGDPVVMERAGGVATIRGDIEATQGDTLTVDEIWEIEMRRAPNGRWRLWTTRTID